MRAYADSSLTPVNRSRAEWYGDDLMTLGPGIPQLDGGVPAGANLLWVDALGNVRGEQVGANAILQSAGTSIQTIVAAPASVSATGGRWDVVWVESSGGGEVLLFNELDCQ